MSARTTHAIASVLIGAALADPHTMAFDTAGRIVFTAQRHAVFDPVAGGIWYGSDTNQIGRLSVR